MKEKIVAHIKCLSIIILFFLTQILAYSIRFDGLTGNNSIDNILSILILILGINIVAEPIYHYYKNK